MQIWDWDVDANDDFWCQSFLSMPKREKRVKRKEIKWNNVGKEAKLKGLKKEEK